MAVQEISKYLNEVLSPQLTRYGVSTQFLADVCQVVEMQMLSALRRWQDVAFRKTLLFIASEEGPFYEPAGKVEVKCFVVMTLRNSPFESLQSDDYAKCGLSVPLTNNQIKAVTSTAIRYFNTLDFAYLSREVQAEHDHPDLYGELSNRYPIAWNALASLAASSSKVVSFPKIDRTEASCLLEGIDAAVCSDPKETAVIFDGYSSEIDPALAEQLTYIISDSGALMVGCFKMLTRNIEKLLRVMEFLLTHGSSLVTSNYYIENGYAERRTIILRAAHTPQEVKRQSCMIKGLGPKHRQALKAASSSSDET